MNKKELSTNIEELHNKIFTMHGNYMHEESEKLFREIDIIYELFLKIKRELLSKEVIELTNKGGKK